MSHIPVNLRNEVILRAVGRFEYCRLSQAGQEATFHIDHVIPESAGGPTEMENLALACVSCSLRKAARQKALDPADGKETELFHPRLHGWSEHFRFDGNLVVGHTPTGRATVLALQMNRPLIIAIRAEEQLRGRHPPRPGE